MKCEQKKQQRSRGLFLAITRHDRLGSTFTFEQIFVVVSITCERALETTTDQKVRLHLHTRK
jgi:hypothetical protein